MANADDQPPKGKTYKASVTLEVPKGVPNFEFLQRRVNTEMTFCGDVESVTNNGVTTKLSLASGHLTVLLDETIRQKFPSAPETLLSKNICITGFLTPADQGFQMVIKNAEQIMLSGH